MQTVPIEVPKSEALRLYREYKKHQHYSTPLDDEIRRAYQLIAQGKLVIRALESIKLAGLGPNGLPKLAICRADTQRIACRVWSDGSANMDAESPNWRQRVGFNFLRGTFDSKRVANGTSTAPPIPVHLRPKRGLQNYHILWEAEWTPVPPGDPYLLRRIGKSDMWLVVAAWDLTAVEKAALATRLQG